DVVDAHLVRGDHAAVNVPVAGRRKLRVRDHHPPRAVHVLRFDPVREDDVAAQSVDAKIVGTEDLPRGASVLGCTGDAAVQLRGGAIALRGSSIRRTSGGRGCAFVSRLVPRDERSAGGSSREQTSRNPTYRRSHLPRSRVAANLRRVSAAGNYPRSHAARSSKTERRGLCDTAPSLAFRAVDENPYVRAARAVGGPVRLWARGSCATPRSGPPARACSDGGDHVPGSHAGNRQVQLEVAEVLQVTQVAQVPQVAQAQALRLQ